MLPLGRRYLLRSRREPRRGRECWALIRRCRRVLFHPIPRMSRFRRTVAVPGYGRPAVVRRWVPIQGHFLVPGRGTPGPGDYVRFSITIRQSASLRSLIEAIPQQDWTPIPYWMEGAADVAETSYTPLSGPDAAPVRLTAREPTPGSQLALFASLPTGRGKPWNFGATPRSENAIRDLAVGLNHLPSGRFPANAAWLAVQVIAHNLARWTARIGLGEQIVTTKTLRRRFFSMAGRLTRSARRLTLHLPQRWPWENQFSGALARFRALPLPS